MERKTNNSSTKQTEPVCDVATRPYCVFYVDLATPKAILADTVMASSGDEARQITSDKHTESLILYVRGVGTDDDNRVSGDMDRACNRDLPPLEGLPGARFIDGEFRASQNNDETELDALSD